MRDPEPTLLVVAHPDDESLFFAPLMRQTPSLRVLCVTRGEGDGDPDRRSAEMRAACSSFGLGPDRVEFLDDPRFIDGRAQSWDVVALADRMTEVCARTGARRIVTFDSDGASGHPNHRACGRAAELLVGEDLDVRVLETLGWTRFAGLPGALRHLGRADVETLWAPMRGPLAAARGLARHRSQHRWYRFLHVLTAQYCVANVLARANAG